MSDEKAIYWLTQVSGWFGYILLILFQNLMVGNVDLGIVKVLFVNFALGILVSHLIRTIIVRSGMLTMQIFRVIPRILLLSIAAGIASSVVYALISDQFFANVSPILTPPYGLLIELLFPFGTVYLFWCILYFAAIYLKNYEREEVKNLRLTASMNEIELGNLRAQLNPHFMFNALNGIRALVDENPAQAKTSITQMSRMLRNSLIAGRKKVVTLKDELTMVQDYLSLEKIRYEQRLDYTIEVPAELEKALIPPLMLQTLVENAIKHGISKLPKGGAIRVSAAAQSAPLQYEPTPWLRLTVANTGEYQPNRAIEDGETAVGLENSRRRLKLLFGEGVSLHISSHHDEVVCDVHLPLLTDKEFKDENIID